MRLAGILVAFGHHFGNNSMHSSKLQSRHRTSIARSSIKHLIGVIAIVGYFGASQANEQSKPETDYLEVAAAVSATMRAYHYNPKELDMPDYLRIEAAVSALGESAKSDDEFVEGFRQIWSSGPFSHVASEPIQEVL